MSKRPDWDEYFETGHAGVGAGHVSADALRLRAR